MKAVVMAGGEGSRLRPITANRPKPLVPVGNVPLMSHIFALLTRHGITDVVATLHYLADEIQSYYDDGSEFGIHLSYSIEDTPLGTAGSVKKAEAQLRDGTFLIISGDALTDCDLQSAIDFHRERGSMATLILYRVPNPLDFGVVICNDDGRITRFLEKPSWSEVFSDTVNTGMYILEPEIFDLMQPGRPYDWSQDVFPQLLLEGKPLYGYVMEQYWSDVGALGQYRDAQDDLLSGKTSLPMSGAEARPGIWIGEGSDVDAEAVLEAPVLIGKNCRIKRRAQIGPSTVIGDNCVVEEGARLEHATVWESSYIGPNVTAQAAIVCARATVKRDTTIGEDSVIGDRCLIDVGCTIRPRVKLWPDKIIERGSTVTMSLVWGHKWRGGLFRELGVAGLSNIEITPDFATRLGSAFGSTLPERSRIVTSRDSSRSSRMIKRAVIASLLSTGCNVLDLRTAAVPIARHFIKASGAAGAVNVRKLPGNARVTLLELFDHHGGYLPKMHERKVETLFFREDFRRVDSDDIGVIEFASRALEEYQNDFFRLLPASEARRRLHVVCDYGYSGISSMFPSMLAKLEIESISVNGYNDAKLAPRTPEDVAAHLVNLRQIVSTLGYDMGVLFTEDDERLTLVDGRGRLVIGHTLLATLGMLVAKTREKPTIAISIAAPSKLEEFLASNGATVVRSKVGTRNLMESLHTDQIAFAGDDRGGFIFPELHPGFDAMFSLAQLLAMLQNTGLRLSDIIEQIPEFHMAYEQARCPWEAKGSVMRRLSESVVDADRVELLDGVKIYTDSSWVLVLPDAVEPVFHVYAESGDAATSTELVSQFASRIHELQSEA